MASSNRKKRHWVSMLTLLDASNLHELRVTINRMNIPEPDTETPLLTDIDDPLIVAKLVHYRTDKEPRPIFSREDIVVNQEDIIEERVISTGRHEDKRTLKEPSHNTSQPHSPKGSERNKKPNQRSKSPIPHSSKSYAGSSKDPDYYLEKSKRGRRSSSKFCDNHPQSRTSLSPRRTPPRYDRDRKSRSPRDFRSNKSPPRYKSEEGEKVARSPSRGKRRQLSRSPPPKHRVAAERRRSPESREVRRSSSHSPYRVRRSRSRERRHSRSPHRRDSRKSKRRSRESYWYSPEHRTRRNRSPKPQSHDHEVARLQDFPFYKGNEYWYPGAMQPPFLPPGFIPPGAIPRFPGPVIMPRMPMMRPPRGYRPRLPVYNRPKVQPAAIDVKPATITSASSTSGTSTVTVSSSITSTRDVGNDAVSSCDLQQTSGHSSIVDDNNKEVHRD